MENKFRFLHDSHQTIIIYFVFLHFHFLEFYNTIMSKFEMDYNSQNFGPKLDSGLR